MTLYVIHLIATSVSLARHVVDRTGLASSHTVRSEAARYRESVRSHWCWGNLRKRILGHSCHGVGRRRLGCLGLAVSNRAGFPSTLDPFVAVLVVRGEVFEKLAISFGDFLARGNDIGELHCKLLECLLVEVILVRLHVSKL